MDHVIDFNTQRPILDYKRPLSYELMTKFLEIFSQRYSFLNISSIGKTVFGRDIPIISLGKGERSAFYVGAHHGSEWITSVLLLRFINEYSEMYKNGSIIYNHTLDYIYEKRRIYIVPMLNADGVDYQINGISRENILYERVMRMNNGNDDFSHWQANARGVDLNHNYNCGFMEYKSYEHEQGIFGGADTKYSGTEPESEPETRAICDFLRLNKDIMAVLSLHSQGEEIFYSSQGRMTERSLSFANVFSRMSGYKLSTPTGSAVYGGLLDWCIQQMNIPAFTIECGKGENPLPLDNYFKIYSDLREILFLCPTML